MNVFQLVKTVLDEIYPRIEGSPARKNGQIKLEIDSLKTAYENLGKRGVPNNYSKAITQFAYVYKYTTSHANVIYQLLESCPQLARLFDRPEVNVTCIGGGPGSEILGLLKYLIHANKTPEIRITLFDKEPTWGECWFDVHEKLKTQLRIQTSFVTFDVTDPTSWISYRKFLSSDLFTLVYFMSEINSLREQSEPFFTNLFEKAKTGSLMLYVDNNSPRFYPWFDALISQHKWRVIAKNERRLRITDDAEQKVDLGAYFTAFGPPKIRANIAYRVCQKQ